MSNHNSRPSTSRIHRRRFQSPIEYLDRTTDGSASGGGNGLSTNASTWAKSYQTEMEGKRKTSATTTTTVKTMVVERSSTAAAPSINFTSLTPSNSSNGLSFDRRHRTISAATSSSTTTTTNNTSFLTAEARLAAKSMDSGCTVTKDKATGIATISIDNAPKNVLSLGTVKLIVRNLRLLQESKDIRALVLTSATPNVFSCGFDLSEFIKPEPKRLRSYWSWMMDLWIELYKTRLTTVVAINGEATGGGFVMAACCDRRIMASNCGSVGFTETSLGITLPYWIISRVGQLMGTHKAEVVLTGANVMNAEQAAAVGLIDRVTTLDRLIDVARDELSKLLVISDISRINTKFTMRQSLITQAEFDRENTLDLLTEYKSLAQA